MINIKEAITRGNKKASVYNNTHKHNWKGYVITNNTLYIFQHHKDFFSGRKKIEYIPFFGLKNTIPISQKSIKKIARIK